MVAKYGIQSYEPTPMEGVLLSYGKTWTHPM